MVKSTWKETILAESANYEALEGNIYFPPESVRIEYFRDSDLDYECPWKGHADYYDIVVQGEVIKDAAWYYLSPKSAASQIKGYVAFDTSKGIVIDQ